MKNRQLSVTIECFCGFRHGYAHDAIPGECPKCHRDGSKFEIVDEYDFDEECLKATAWMVENGGLDPLPIMNR